MSILSLNLNRKRVVAGLALAAVVSGGGASTALAASPGLAPVANGPAARMVASQGNLYWSSNSYTAVNGKDYATANVMRTAQGSSPGAERSVFSENTVTRNGEGSATFGAIAYANIPYNSADKDPWSGYVVVNDPQSDQSTIDRFALAGGMGGETISTPFPQIGNADLVSDGTNIYWAGSSGIESLPVTTTTPTTPTSVLSVSGVTHLQSAGGYLYYTVGAQMLRIPEEVANPTPQTVVNETSPFTAFDVTIRGTSTPYIYWGLANGEVRSDYIGGSPVTYQAATSGTTITGVTLGGSTVAWADLVEGNDTDIKASVNGVTSTLLAPAQRSIVDLQGNSSGLYWGDVAAGVERYGF